MDLTITVREMTTADVAAVAELEAKAFDDPWSPAAFFEELAAPGRYYSVVEEDGYVAGYGGVMHVEDDAHVMTIAVDPEVAKRLAADGADAVGNSPDEFGAHIRSEVAKYGKIIQKIGLKAD